MSDAGRANCFNLRANKRPFNRSRFFYLVLCRLGLWGRLPLVAPRRGRRTALTFPVFPPPQKNWWEPDSPEGYPQTPPYKWWNWHDNYDAESSPNSKWVDIITDPQAAAARRRDEEAKAS
jgi:hypothetical protein